jgi:hypothetical protein
MSKQQGGKVVNLIKPEYQGETPLDYQYTLKKNKIQKRKSSIFHGWVTVRAEQAQ